MDVESQLERRMRHRLRAEPRQLERLDRRLAECEPLIGELCQDGRTVFYVNLRSRDGRLTGNIRRFERRDLARHYLIDHRYC